MGLRASRRRAVVTDDRGRTRRLPVVPSLERERRLWAEGATVAGLDEVGRGAWAGPVTVGVVVLAPDRRIYKLRDSKLLDAARREALAARIAERAVAHAVGHATSTEIDRLGLTAALRLAARRALAALEVRPDVVLIDGHLDLIGEDDTGIVRIPVVHGDAICASIAAASIVAKVTRDRSMVAQHDRWPAYGFAANKGYPSPAHRRALREFGPCPLHRQRWAPVAALRQGRLFPE